MPRLRLKQRSERGHTLYQDSPDVMAPGYVVYWTSDISGDEHRYTLSDHQTALGALEAVEWLRGTSARDVRVRTVHHV